MHNSFEISAIDQLSESNKLNVSDSEIPKSDGKIDDEIQVITLMDECIQPSQVDSNSSAGEIYSLQVIHPLAYNAPTLRRGKVGLENPGFFCYLNSGLQCLLSINSFRDYFFQIEFNSNKFIYSELISDITKSIFKLNKGTLRPLKL